MKTLTKKIAPVILFIGLFFISGITSAQTVGYTYTGNEYTVIDTYEEDGNVYVIVRNPWGQIEEIDESQLANIDLQNTLQKQQQTIQMMSNISKILQDTALAVIRKVG